MQQAVGCWETLASMCTWQNYKNNKGQVTGKQSFYKTTSRQPQKPPPIPRLNIGSIHNKRVAHRSILATQFCERSFCSVSSLCHSTMAPAVSTMVGSEISTAEPGTLFHGSYIDMMMLAKVRAIEVPESSRGKPLAKHWGLYGFVFV